MFPEPGIAVEEVVGVLGVVVGVVFVAVVAVLAGVGVAVVTALNSSSRS